MVNENMCKSSVDGGFEVETINGLRMSDHKTKTSVCPKEIPFYVCVWL